MEEENKIGIFLVFLLLVVALLTFLPLPSRVGNKLDSGKLVKGWYPKEKHGRWMQQEAEIAIRSGGKGELTFKGYIPPAAFHKFYNYSLEIKLFADDHLLICRKITGKNFNGGIIKLTAAVAKKKILYIRIALNKSFVPSVFLNSTDKRELGMFVSQMKID